MNQQRLSLSPSQSPYEADKVALPREQFVELIDRSNLLEALLDAGLEDWEGYDDALEIKKNYQGETYAE